MYSFALFRRKIHPWIITGLVITGVASASSPGLSCAPDSAEVIESGSTHKVPALQQEGYRTISVRWDPLLRQRWATIVSCDHPERPSIALLLHSTPQDKATEVSPISLPTIHSGDVVRLWRQENDLRIEVSGVAQESGARGSRVRVKLLRSGLDGQQQEQTLFGIVRGQRDVEIQR
jgi:hypothetical protein